MKFEEQIAEHAKDDAPNECCGLILLKDGEKFAERCANTSENPKEFFRIDPIRYLKAVKEGNLVGYYHSHTNDSRDFSPQDIAISEATMLPLYLYVVGTGELVCYTPVGVKHPLEGRTFVPGLHDCWAIVHDYYQEKLNISLPFIPRDDRDYFYGVPEMESFIEETGLIQVTSPKEHDIVLMSIQSPLPNHAAIYLGDGHILHQRANDVSRRDVYGGYWQKNTVLILRHPNYK